MKSNFHIKIGLRMTQIEMNMHELFQSDFKSKKGPQIDEVFVPEKK